MLRGENKWQPAELSNSSRRLTPEKAFKQETTGWQHAAAAAATTANPFLPSPSTPPPPVQVSPDTPARDHDFCPVSPFKLFVRSTARSSAR